MSSFVIEGGYRLSGEIVPQGAKNEALQVICATLLTPEKVTIHNVPDILDVNNLIQLLRDMQVKVEHPAADTYTFQADAVDLRRPRRSPRKTCWWFRTTLRCRSARCVCVPVQLTK